MKTVTYKNDPNNSNKNPILTFPYHDPNGKCNKLFKKTLSKIKNIFPEIYISATPMTISKNKAFVSILEKSGCIVYKNNKNTGIGDHYRNALRLASNSKNYNKIFFGFIDRILFILNTNLKNQFIKDITKDSGNLTLYERTDKAWRTYPKTYKKIEQTVNMLSKILFDKEIELATCGFIISSDLAKNVLNKSVSNYYDVCTEWILLAHLYGIKIKTKKVNWLAWEDPFIEGVNSDKLKMLWENNQEENKKRIEMNIPFINILLEKRFNALLKNKY